METDTEWDMKGYNSWFIPDIAFFLNLFWTILQWSCCSYPRIQHCLFTISHFILFSSAIILTILFQNEKLQYKTPILEREEGKKGALGRKTWGCSFTGSFYLTTRSYASSTKQILEWNKQTFKDLSVSAVKALAGELEKLGTFLKLKNQEVEGLLDFLTFCLVF